MLSWSINLFRIRGIRISLHFSFVLFLAYICYDGYQDGGWPSLWFNTGIFLAFFTCVVLHELGHSLTAMHFGVNVRRILLMPIGGMAEFERIPKRPSEELWITVAGPSVNFVLAGLLWAWMHVVYAHDIGYVSEFSTPVFLQTLLLWNIRVGLFNLIPAFPMDGGRILRALLAIKFPYLRATYWAATLAKIILIPAIAWEIFAGDSGGKGFLIAIFAFIFMAGEAEYQAVKRREEAEAFWKAEMVRRMTPVTPEEPPILNG
jgi:Zn-dependent protease